MEFSTYEVCVMFNLVIVLISTYMTVPMFNGHRALTGISGIAVSFIGQAVTGLWVFWIAVLLIMLCTKQGRELWKIAMEIRKMTA